MYAQPPSYPSPEQRSGKMGGLGGGAPGPLAQLRGIPDGYAGTTQIIEEMKKLALDSYRDERVNQLAREITINCPRHDHACEAAVVLKWFQDTFRYTRLPFHPQGLQRLQTPSYTLFDAAVKSGECASLSTAMAAVLMSLGFEVAYRTAGQDPSNPLDLEHVYLMVNIPDAGWTAAEPSYEEGLGWEHPAAAVKQDWPIA